MNTRTIERNGREWLWPADDITFIHAFDQHKDIDVIVKHLDKTDVCIQAGGACGVWPYYLSKIFSRVYTFEPEPVNFQCLLANAPDAIKYNSALGGGYPQELKRHPTLVGNAGAWYTRPSIGGFPSIRLDDMSILNLDLIQLDVEGSEWDVLDGARGLLDKYHPLVVIEEKRLPQGISGRVTARKLLEAKGYQEVGRIHRDVIFKQKGGYTFD